MAALKMSGAEFKDWQNAEWGEDAWWDDYVIFIDGKEVDDYDPDEISDQCRIEIHGGVVLLDRNGEKQVSAAAHFRNWKRSKTHSTIVADIPLGRMDEVIAAISAAGGKVRP